MPNTRYPVINVLIFFLSFWLTALALRVVIFWAFLYGKIPAVYFYHWHIHHFVFGLMLLFAAGALYYFSEVSEFLLSALSGMGAGLLLDEFLYWTRWHFDYWNWTNFLVLVMVALGLFVWYVYLKKNQTALPALPWPARKHQNPLRPEISVVVPAHNEEKFLPVALFSLSRQTFKNFELIVVDNNSTDRTAALAAEWGAQVVKEPQAGVGLARQAGFAAAKGEIIATTDADTKVPPDWLGTIIKKFRADDKLVATGGLYRLYSGSLFSKWFFRYLANLVWRLDRKLSGIWSLPGANLAVRKRAFWQVGGFNVKLKMLEDVDLSRRLAALGRVELDPKLLVETSGRRFRNGLLPGILNYAPNLAMRLFFGKLRFNQLKTVRTEASPWLVAALPFLVSLAFLYALFSFHNTLLAQAEQNRSLRGQLRLYETKIRSVIRQKEQNIKRLRLPSQNGQNPLPNF